MQHEIQLTILALAGFLAAQALIPRTIANQAIQTLISVGLGVLAITATLSLLLAGEVIVTELLQSWSANSQPQTTLSHSTPPLSLLMVSLISVIGCTVVQFSIRYLAGDVNQGNFLRWMNSALGFAMLTVLANNLVWLLGAWAATSLAMHRLLLFYPNRPAAQVGAWGKFIASRLGDAALIAAAIIAYLSLGTTSLDALNQLQFAEYAQPYSLEAIAFLIAIAALAKSAQFPLHAWLPETMETPTPVSALMHAGVINAGGYVAIRLAPFLTQSPSAISLFVIAGSISAFVGALSMMTQPAVKRSLAYSTVSQIGFMFFQIGLGHSGAALIHIIGHSIYKAASFLYSGSVVDCLRLPIRAKAPAAFSKVAGSSLAASVLAVLIIGVPAYFLGNLNPTRVNDLALLGIMIAATAFAIRRSFLSGNPTPTLIFAALISIGASAYFSLFFLFEQLLDGQGGIEVTLENWGFLTAMLLGTALILTLCVIELAIEFSIENRLLSRLYVASLNGFYWDTYLMAWTRKICKQVKAENPERPLRGHVARES